MSAPLVSVMTIVYNGEKFIEKCIRGILDQSYRNLEFVIVNDGSQDRTLEICSRYAELDPRIKLYSNDRNLGLTYTRNRALENCTGDYIAVNDADDFSYPERLERQLAFMENHPEVGICGTGAMRVFDDGRQVPWIFPESDAALRCEMLWRVPCLNSTVIMRKATLDQYGIKYLDGYASCEDFKLFWDVAKHQKLHNLQEILVDYAQHEAQQTKIQRHDMANDTATIVIEQLNYLGLELSEEMKKLLRRVFRYSFGFDPGEILQIREVYSKLLTQQNRNYDQDLLRKQVAERFLMICYFSTHQSGLSAYRAFQGWQFNSYHKLSSGTRVKFLLRAILKLK